MMARPYRPSFVVRLPQDFKVKADARAKSLGLTLSRYIRKLIAADLGVDPPQFDLGLPPLPTPEPYRKPGQKKPDWKRINDHLEMVSPEREKARKGKKSSA